VPGKSTAKTVSDIVFCCVWRIPFLVGDRLFDSTEDTPREGESVIYSF